MDFWIIYIETLNHVLAGAGDGPAAGGCLPCGARRQKGSLRCGHEETAGDRGMVTGKYGQDTVVISVFHENTVERYRCTGTTVAERAGL